LICTLAYGRASILLLSLLVCLSLDLGFGELFLILKEGRKCE